MERNEQFAYQKNYVPQARMDIVNKQTVGSFMIKDENPLEANKVILPMNDEEESEIPEGATTINKSALSDARLMNDKPEPTILKPTMAKNFRDQFMSVEKKKAKATEDIVVQHQDVADLFDEMIGIDEAFE